MVALFVLESEREIEVGVLVHRQKIMVDALTEREKRLRHIGAVVVVKSAGTDVLAG